MFPGGDLQGAVASVQSVPRVRKGNHTGHRSMGFSKSFTNVAHSYYATFELRNADSVRVRYGRRSQCSGRGLGSLRRESWFVRSVQESTSRTVVVSLPYVSKTTPSMRSIGWQPFVQLGSKARTGDVATCTCVYPTWKGSVRRSFRTNVFSKRHPLRGMEICAEKRGPKGNRRPVRRPDHGFRWIK